MKKSRRQAPTESAPPRREDFATWTDYQAALSASDVADDFELLFELPQTLEDWIDYELTNARHWWASHPPLPSDPPPEFLRRAEERARHSYESTKGTP